MKRAAFDEDVKVGLKEELQDLLHGRLINLGISPDWNGLSDETFERALSIMRHQSSLACKVINFKRIFKLINVFSFLEDTKI